MITGAIAGSVDVLAELKDRGVPVYAITNGFVETFPPQRLGAGNSRGSLPAAGSAQARARRAGPASARPWPTLLTPLGAQRFARLAHGE